MKKVLYALIIIASIYIINNLVRSIYSLWQKQDLIVAARDELGKEKNEYEKLKDQLTKVKRQDYVEEEARDKLFLIKTGEKIVLVPETTLSATVSAESKTPPLPVWEQWLQVFFNNGKS